LCPGSQLFRTPQPLEPRTQFPSPSNCAVCRLVSPKQSPDLSAPTVGHFAPLSLASQSCTSLDVHLSLVEADVYRRLILSTRMRDSLLLGVPDTLQDPVRRAMCDKSARIAYHGAFFLSPFPQHNLRAARSHLYAPLPSGNPVRPAWPLKSFDGIF